VFDSSSSASAAIAALSTRHRLLIVTCIVLITLLAWVYLVHLDHQMAADMEHEEMMAAMGMTMDMSWKSADVFFTFAMWVVMMVGMMAPSASPMVLLFASSRANRSDRGVSADTLAFGLGYVAIWAAFSAGATLAQWGLHQATMLSSATMALSSGRLSGAILITAGLYQLTSWKGKCLIHCRSPLGFLMTHWRDGITGAFRMGMHHGAYCLGCCWALMCVLFVVGVMNLLWVAALTAFVLVEKLGPAGAVVARIAGVGLVVGGIATIA
jgi:predicted metal-binding membrane protein